MWHVMVHSGEKGFVFGLWEGIHWADQFEEMCDTAQW